MGFDKYGNQRILEAAMQQPSPQMAIAAPINDIQLVALIAAQRAEAPAAEAVSWAVDVLVEAVAQAPLLQERIKKHQALRLANGKN